MMMAEKIRNVLLKITGFVIGFATITIAIIVVEYLFGTAAFLLIIIAGCITLTLVIFRTYKKLTNEIEDLKKEINRLKEKK